MNAKARSVIIAIAVLAVAAGFLGFTKPGHQMLYKLGFTTACSGDSCS